MLLLCLQILRAWQVWEGVGVGIADTHLGGRNEEEQFGTVQKLFM